MRSFQFAGYTLDSRVGCLCAGDRPIALRRKSYDVLCYLVENAGRLVSKEELIETVWRNVTVGDESLTRCVSDIRLALKDQDQKIIKTVHGRGYILAVPMTTTEIEPSTGSSESTRHVGQDSARSRNGAVNGISVVVLPFTNLSGDPRQDYVADLITEGLTAYISRLRGSFVIARTTAAAYKSKAIDIRCIGKELGVRYVLEGSAHNAGKYLRVNARLIDALSGALLWAEQCRADSDDLLQMLDQIVTRVARTLQIELTIVEAARLSSMRLPCNQSQDLAMRGEAIILQYGPWHEAANEAFEFCEHALCLDPCNVLALSTLVEKFTFRLGHLQSFDRGDDVKKAEELASRALAIEPNSYHARHAKARVLVAQQRLEEALVMAERGLALNPSFIPIYLDLCQGHFFLGEAEKVVEYASTAIRLSPRDPWLGVFHTHEGHGYALLNNELQSIDCYRRAIATNPEIPVIYVRLAVALASTGQDAEGRRVLDQYLSHPRTRTRTIAQLRAAGIETSNPCVLAFREKLYDGLQKLGMPDK